MVDNLTHTEDVQIATSMSVEADFAREKMYIAPQVGTCIVFARKRDLYLRSLVI